MKATTIILPTQVVRIINYPAKTPAFHSANNKWSLAPKHYLELIQQGPMSFPSARVIRQWREYLPQSLHQLLAEIHSGAEILPLHDPSARAPDFDALSKSKAGSPNTHDHRARIKSSYAWGCSHTVSVPTFYATGSRKKAFLYSALSGLAEPIGAIIAYAAIRFFLGGNSGAIPPEIIGIQIIGILFGGVAGIMVYISLDELLPTSRTYGKGHDRIFGLVAGMLVIGKPTRLKASTVQATHMVRNIST